ncbi:MAG: hypothetical protein P8Y44_06330 [Acidobacteriota bacterium]
MSAFSHRPRVLTLILLLVFPLGSAVAADSPAVTKLGEVVPRVATRASVDQQYSLYLPSAYTLEKCWPALIVLDPRGRAVMALELFRAAAERHGYVVLSSYQSRSDTAWAVTTEALKALLEETEQRYSIDPQRVYLAGLSGTSRAAWAYAHLLSGRVAGVVGVAGARPHTIEIDDSYVGFDYFGITGRTDFNHREMVELSLELVEADADHHLEIFDGGHSWPPPELAGSALDWFQLQAMRSGQVPTDIEFVDSQLEQAIARFESSREILERVRRCQDICRDFEGFRDVSSYPPRCRELVEGKDYKRAVARRSKIFDQEKIYVHRRLGPWLAKFHRDDQTPPTVSRSLIELQIRSLQKRATSPDDAQDADSAQRLIDDVYATAAYYLPRDMQEAGNLDRAALSLQVAIEVDPARRRAYWALAEIYAEAGRKKSAFETLRQAIALGRVDYDRLTTDPSWQLLRQDTAWEEILRLAEAAVD